MPNADDTWLSAIRGIKDNPLVVYLRQAEQRRLARVGWFRRNLFFVLVIALAVIIESLLCADFFDSHSGGIWDALFDRDFMLASAALLVLPAYIVWACQGLYQAVLDALLVLAPPSRRTHHLALDDLSSITLLSDREIVAGALAILLPPLLKRQVVGSVLLYASLMIFAYSETARDQRPFFIEEQFFSPLNLLTVSFCGAVAMVSLLLFLLALGRDMRPALASAAAMIMVPAQVAYGGLALGMSFLPQEAFGDIASGVYLPSMLCVALLMLLLLVYACRAGLKYRALGNVLAVGAPLLAVLIPVVAVILFGIYTQFNGPSSEVFGLSVFNYAAGLGAFSVLNPMAVLVPVSLLSPTADINNVPWPEWLRFPLLVALQAGLAAMFAHYAVQAVRLRRQAG